MHMSDAIQFKLIRTNLAKQAPSRGNTLPNHTRPIPIGAVPSTRFPSQGEGRDEGFGLSRLPTITFNRQPMNQRVRTHRRNSGCLRPVNVGSITLLHSAAFRLRRLSIVIAVLAVALIATVSVNADIIHTKAGDSYEGELIEDIGTAYHVRTRLGVSTVKKKDIERIEKKPSPWAEYRKRRKACKNTAEAHYELALWCDENGLTTERRDELEHAIKINPNHEPSRAALGFERNARGEWEEPKVQRSAASRARRERQIEQRRIEKIITEYHVKVRAIHDGRMSPKRRNVTREKFMKARATLLEMDDVLAIPALTNVLSEGTTAARLVLIEALSQFDHDDATMNLLVLSVLDGSERVRRAAARELRRRDDPRVVDRLRDALESDEENVIRNAATALGEMKANETVADLIAHLSIKKMGTVRLTRPVYLGQIYGTFGGPTHIVRGGQIVRYDPVDIGVVGSGHIIGTDTGFVREPVAVYRTEVQEALIAITGQNFGFDEQAWLKWWDENKARR